MAHVETNLFYQFLQVFDAFDTKLSNDGATLRLIEKDSDTPTQVTIGKMHNGNGVEMDIKYMVQPDDHFSIQIYWITSENILVLPYCEGHVECATWSEMADFIGKVRSLDKLYGNLMRMLAGDEAYAGHFRLDIEAVA